MSKKISIITPSFQQGQFIEQTIQSVLAQEHQPLEYWIIDGGSTDQTQTILKKYDQKLNWISQKDRGQTHAINKGLKKVTGDIIGFLNADDLLLPHALQTVVKHFKSDTAWLIGDYQIIDQRGYLAHQHSIVEQYKRFLLSRYSNRLLKIANNFIPQPSTFWSRAAFAKVGLFDESLDYVMDYDYWLKLSQHYQPKIISTKLSAFRVHPDSKSMSMRPAMLREAYQVSQRYANNAFEIKLHQAHTLLVSLAYKLLG